MGAVSIREEVISLDRPGNVSIGCLGIDVGSWGGVQDVDAAI
jgi:hypothetical protein